MIYLEILTLSLVTIYMGLLLNEKFQLYLMKRAFLKEMEQIEKTFSKSVLGEPLSEDLEDKNLH